VKVGAGAIRCFLVDFGVTVRQSVFSFWSVKSLGFGRPTGAVDSSLESPRNYADIGVCNRAKTGMILGGFEFVFGGLFYDIPGAWLVCICSDTLFVSMLESDRRRQRLVPAVFRFVYFVLSQGECFGL
jgi:hypothetical protein